MNTREEACRLLERLGAPRSLRRHVQLVQEVGDCLLEKLEALNVKINKDFVLVGIILHDVGKTKYIEELSQPGSMHELEGQNILLEQGLPPNIARVCLSHARWDTMECSPEELLIALSDKLWKGNRVPELELKVIDFVSEALEKDRWDLFTELDSFFESLASDGQERLLRSLG